MILSLVTIKAPFYYAVRVCYFVELTTDYLQDRFFFLTSLLCLHFLFLSRLLSWILAVWSLYKVERFPLRLVKVICHVMPEPVTKYRKIVNIRESRPLMTLSKYFRESFSPSRLCHQKDRYFSLISVVYRLILSLSKDSVSKPLRVEYFTWRSFVEASIINLKMCEIGSWGNLVLSRSFVRVSKMSIWGTLWIWLCK